MNMTKEIEAILVEPTRAKTLAQTNSYVQWRVFAVVQEMAKRIEALERKVQKHHDEWLLNT